MHVRAVRASTSPDLVQRVMVMGGVCGGVCGRARARVSAQEPLGRVSEAREHGRAPRRAKGGGREWLSWPEP